jgi:hypothetical protein
LSKVIPILGIYIIGVVAYLGGLFILANKIGTVIGIWEAVAIGLALFTAVRQLTKNGEKVIITKEIVFFGVLLIIGLFLVIYAGDKFLGFFFKE